MAQKGRKGTKEELQITKDCQTAYDKGWPIRFTAQKLGISKDAVWRRYKKFRADESASMDKEFISEQRYHKEQAMKALQEQIEKAREYVEWLDDMIEEDVKNRTAWSAQEIKLLENITSWEQQLHALGMSRTVDISIRKLLEERDATSDKSGDKDTRQSE